MFLRLGRKRVCAPKPRLRMTSGTARSEFAWVCLTQVQVGYGHTPQGAYNAWCVAVQRGVYVVAQR